MGLDFGAKTVGVAISDPLLITAQGIEIIRRKEENKLRRTLARIEELIEVYQIGEIVLGLPKHMNDTEGTRVELTKEFAEKLERRTGLPVQLWDERLTTVAADKTMMEAGIRREHRKEYVDKIAFTLEGEGTAWFYVLEQTMIGGRHYLLVTEEEEGDCDALILKEIPQEEDTDSIYEIVEEDTELAAVASVFESMLEDIEIEP